MSAGQILRCGLIALMCVIAAPVFAQFEEIRPSIPAGYVPPAGTDEHEIWASLEKVETEIRRSPLVITDESLNAYVRDIICRLDDAVCQDIRLYIVRNPQFNAMMYPNGMMIVWTGLLIRMRNEAQLAAVLGHEMGHYLRQHSLQTWRAGKSAANVGLFVNIVSAGAGVSAVGDLVNLGILAGLFKYSRDHETEADVFGAQHMAEAGYDVRAAAAVWAYVEKEERSAIYKTYQPMIFRSHPVNSARFELLDELAREEQVGGGTFGDRYWQKLSPYYVDLMSDQLNMNRPGRSESLLQEHEQYDIDKSLVEYEWGEYYKRRNQDGDIDSAIEHYENSLASPDAPSGALRELGILEMKQKRFNAARAHLSRYVSMRPDADDREIVDFYLQMMESKQ